MTRAFFQRDQAATDHGIGLGKNLLDAIFLLHDLDDHRQIRGESEHTISMKPGARCSLHVSATDIHLVKPHQGDHNRSGNSLPDPMVATGLEPVTPTM